MSLRCTCGAIPPEDARFCHKCGRPLFDEPVSEAAAVEPPPVPTVIPEPVPSKVTISFSNGRAVATSMAGAAATLFCLVITTLVVPQIAPFLLCASGVLAVFLYTRTTKREIDVRSGARLGWMTGFWLFLVSLIAMTYMAVVISVDSLRQQFLAAIGNTQPQLRELLSHPQEFYAGLAGGLFMTLLFSILLPGLGGMLGAKLFTRKQPSV